MPDEGLVLPCPGCGYDIRGLDLSGRCPECGTALAAALDDRIEHADPEWLRRVYRGLGLMGIAVAFGLLWALLSASFQRPPLPPFRLALLSLIDVVRGGVMLAGSLLITTPEPRLARQETPLTLRRFIRACAAVGFVLDLLGSVRVVLALHPVLSILAKLGLLASLCTLVNQVFYLRRLAGRASDHFLKFVLDMIVHGLLWVCVLAATLTLVILAGRMLTSTPPILEVVCTAIPQAVVFLGPALGLAAIAAACRFRRLLRALIRPQAVAARARPDS